MASNQPTRERRPTKAAVELKRRIAARGLTFQQVADAIGAKSTGTVNDIVHARKKAGDGLRVAIRDEFGIPTDWWHEPADERRSGAAA